MSIKSYLAMQKSRRFQVINAMPAINGQARDLITKSGRAIGQVVNTPILAPEHLTAH
jgi:hypothetical protein